LNLSFSNNSSNNNPIINNNPILEFINKNYLDLDINIPNIKNDLDELSLDYNKLFKKQRVFYFLTSKVYIITKNKNLNKNLNNKNKIIIYKNNIKNLVEPKNYKKAHNSKYSLFWLRSELKKLNILNNNNTWKLVPRPNNIKILANY
jgi:hypothetical protein